MSGGDNKVTIWYKYTNRAGRSAELDPEDNLDAIKQKVNEQEGLNVFVSQIFLTTTLLKLDLRTTTAADISKVQKEYKYNDSRFLIHATLVPQKEDEGKREEDYGDPIMLDWIIVIGYIVCTILSTFVLSDFVSNPKVKYALGALFPMTTTPAVYFREQFVQSFKTIFFFISGKDTKRVLLPKDTQIGEDRNKNSKTKLK
eukprot:c9961_g1_i1.p1 GENE.c9961_g1_i1~~c9961_g1_i1.p1  ORF type:complete len:210 (+),score=39.98 c9961_g1_i1:32-631(+)